MVIYEDPTKRHLFTKDEVRIGHTLDSKKIYHGPLPWPILKIIAPHLFAAAADKVTIYGHEPEEVNILSTDVLLDTKNILYLWGRMRVLAKKTLFGNTISQVESIVEIGSTFLQDGKGELQLREAPQVKINVDSNKSWGPLPGIFIASLPAAIQSVLNKPRDLIVPALNQRWKNKVRHADVSLTHPHIEIKVFPHQKK